MDKKIILLACFLFLGQSPSFAETIYLKDGKKIEGKIVSKTDKAVKVDVRGVTLTYYSDEIEKIDSAMSYKPAIMKTTQPSPSDVKTIEVNPPAQNNKIQSYSPTVSSDASISSLSKQELILALIESTGAKENMNQMFSQIISQAPADEAQKLKEIFNLDEVIARLVPVYDRYFSEEELRGLVGFYKSPLGRKLLTTMPLIMKDSMEASLAYFQEKIPPTPQDQAQGQTPAQNEAPPQGQ